MYQIQIRISGIVSMKKLKDRCFKRCLWGFFLMFLGQLVNMGVCYCGWISSAIIILVMFQVSFCRINVMAKMYAYHMTPNWTLVMGLSGMSLSCYDSGRWCFSRASEYFKWIPTLLSLIPIYSNSQMLLHLYTTSH